MRALGGDAFKSADDADSATSIGQHPPRKAQMADGNASTEASGGQSITKYRPLFNPLRSHEELSEIKPTESSLAKDPTCGAHWTAEVRSKQISPSRPLGRFSGYSWGSFHCSESFETRSSQSDKGAPTLIVEEDKDTMVHLRHSLETNEVERVGNDYKGRTGHLADVLGPEEAEAAGENRGTTTQQVLDAVKKLTPRFSSVKWAGASETSSRS